MDCPAGYHIEQRTPAESSKTGLNTYENHQNLVIRLCLNREIRIPEETACAAASISSIDVSVGHIRFACAGLKGTVPGGVCPPTAI